MQDISDSLGFLVGDVARLLRHNFQIQMIGSPLTQAQSRVLVHVARTKGLRQVELAERLEVRPMTLARLIDQLCVAGLVERQPDHTDRRAHIIVLTEKSASYLEAIGEVGKKIQAKAVAGLTPEESDLVISALKKMRENLALG